MVKFSGGFESRLGWPILKVLASHMFEQTEKITKITTSDNLYPSTSPPPPGPASEVNVCRIQL